MRFIDIIDAKVFTIAQATDVPVSQFDQLRGMLSETPFDLNRFREIVGSLKYLNRFHDVRLTQLEKFMLSHCLKPVDMPFSHDDQGKS